MKSLIKIAGQKTNNLLFLIANCINILWFSNCTHGHVFGPSGLLDPEVMAPCGNGVPCQLWPVVRRHGRGSRGLMEILIWQSVSSARLQDQSSRKVGVRPLPIEPGTRQRQSWAAVTGVVPSPKLGGQGSGGPPLPSNSLLVARAGVRSSTVIRS